MEGRSSAEPRESSCYQLEKKKKAQKSEESTMAPSGRNLECGAQLGAWLRGQQGEVQSDEGLWARPLVSRLWLDLGPESLAVIVDSPQDGDKPVCCQELEGVSHSRSL